MQMLGREADGLPTADLPTAASVLLQHLDGLGVDIGRPYVTLDVRKRLIHVQWNIKMPLGLPEIANIRRVGNLYHRQRTIP